MNRGGEGCGGGSSGKRETEGGGGEGPTGGKRENGSCVKIMELAARVERALPEARCSLAYPVCLNIEPNPTLKAKQTNGSMCEACLPILHPSSRLLGAPPQTPRPTTVRWRGEHDMH